MIRLVDQIDLAEKRVFIRVDFNVPISDGKVLEDSRIKASLPTIRYAKEHGARIILASHLGRPNGKYQENLSLIPVGEKLSELLDMETIVPEDCVGSAVKKLASELKDNQILLLENLRFHPEEEANTLPFSEKLASLAHIYLNDAFGVAHRAHASTVGMVAFFKEKGIGFLMQKEIQALTQLLVKPQSPFLAVFGGSKVGDKLETLGHLMNFVDGILIGGAMAYTFLRARGIPVGASLVEEAKIHAAEKILNRAEIKGVQICLPIDSLVADSPTSTSYQVVENGRTFHGMGVDIGPKTIALFEEKISKANTVFWNGPMGIFENPPYDEGTKALAFAIAKRPISVVGGGDSLAALAKLNIEDHFTHLSTGGGASMEFLEGKTLPGLRVLDY